MSEHEHRISNVVDTMPPMNYCACGKPMPLTEQDKADYRHYTGRDWIDGDPR